MGSNAWFFYALGAAVLWGFGYALSERVMQQGIGPAVLLLANAVVTIPLYIVIARLRGTLIPGIKLLATDSMLFFLTMVVSLTVVIGNYFILQSVAGKNATMATLIEIAYPLFTCIFAWLLFRDVQLTWATAFGGLLILAGIGVIYVKG